MSNVTEFLANVPQPIQWALAGVGAVYVGNRLLSYVQFILNVFVLSGTNVSRGLD